MKFSLRTLLAVVSAVAFYLAIAFAASSPVRLVAVTTLTFLMGPAIITGIIYDRGYARTFWIGCSVTAIIPNLYIAYCFFHYHGSFLVDPGSIRYSDGLIAYPLLACHALVLVSGLTSVAVRWFLIDSQTRHNPVSGSATSTSSEAEDSGL